VARQLDPACNPATTECPQGPLSVDQGQGDQGQGDQGQGDQGQGDQGQGDQGQGDQGQGDQGQGDQGQGDQGAPGGDLTFDDAAGQGNPPNSLTATVTQGPKNILLTWTPPHVRKNHVVSYEVWRILDPNDEGITTAPNGGTFASRVLVGTTSALTLTDFNANNNTWYTYWVQANFDSPPLKSGRSTTVRIKK
jgi:hypothetical protein